MSIEKWMSKKRRQNMLRWKLMLGIMCCFFVIVSCNDSNDEEYDGEYCDYCEYYDLNPEHELCFEMPSLATSQTEEGYFRSRCETYMVHCSNDCELDDRRCVGVTEEDVWHRLESGWWVGSAYYSAVEVCVADDNGCLEWAVEEECNESGFCADWDPEVGAWCQNCFTTRYLEYDEICNRDTEGRCTCDDDSALFQCLPADPDDNMYAGCWIWRFKAQCRAGYCNNIACGC